MAGLLKLQRQISDTSFISLSSDESVMVMLSLNRCLTDTSFIFLSCDESVMVMLPLSWRLTVNISYFNIFLSSHDLTSVTDGCILLITRSQFSAGSLMAMYIYLSLLYYWCVNWVHKTLYSMASYSYICNMLALIEQLVYSFKLDSKS